MNVAMNVGNPIWFLPLSLIRERSRIGAVSGDGGHGAEGRNGSAGEQSEDVSKVTPFGPRPKRPDDGNGRDGSSERPGASRPKSVPDGKAEPTDEPEAADTEWLENRVRALYAEVVDEPLPPDLEKLVREIEKKKR